jgi:hypothetical protein
LNPDTQDPYARYLEIQNSPNASNARKTKRFHILDTPGLNDIGRGKDLQHMIRVLRMISTQYRGVHSLVLVYRFKTRVDAAIGPALCYYRDLFCPLFKAQNVILVLTHVSSDDYELGLFQKTWDAAVQTHLDECNELLELNTPAWNCPINRCFFVNSKWTPPRIDKLLRQIMAKEKIDETDLLYRSYLMREQILDYISEAPEVILDTHLVPLPPALETERISALSVIDGRIKELLKAVRIEDELRANQLTYLEKLRTDFTGVNVKIEHAKAEIKTLSATQKTPSKCVAGDDWIKIFNAGMYSVDAACDSTSPCGGCQYTFKCETHNASHPSDHPITQGRTWTVRVNPNWVNITHKENRYWFYRFWLEYEGTNHNARQIERERRVLSELAAEKMPLSESLKQTEDALKSGEAKAVEHNTNLMNLNKDKDSLLPTRFKISNVEAVLKCIEKNMEV